VILSLDRANKTAPNGKQILKNVGVAMYLGAKIGFLGQNGALLNHVEPKVPHTSLKQDCMLRERSLRCPAQSLPCCLLLPGAVPASAAI